MANIHHSLLVYYRRSPVSVQNACKHTFSYHKSSQFNIFLYYSKQSQMYHRASLSRLYTHPWRMPLKFHLIHYKGPHTDSCDSPQMSGNTTGNSQTVSPTVWHVQSASILFCWAVASWNNRLAIKYNVADRIME